MSHTHRLCGDCPCRLPKKESKLLTLLPITRYKTGNTYTYQCRQKSLDHQKLTGSQINKTLCTKTISTKTDSKIFLPKAKDTYSYLKSIKNSKFSNSLQNSTQSI